MIDIKARSANGAFSLYIVFFVGLWTGYVLLIYRHVQALGESTLAYASVSIAVRLALWILPVLLYLRYLERVDAWRYLKLADGWRRGVVIGIGISALNLAVSVIAFGSPHPAWESVTWNSVLGTSFGVGFFEEIPFRGFILQKLAARMGFWRANVLSSLVFVGMHLPGWITLHLLTASLPFRIFLISFVLGLIFRYSQSLWSCIIAHSANDFFSFVLFHGK